MTLLRGLVSREGPLVSKTGMSSSVSKGLKSQHVLGDTPRIGQKTELQLRQNCLSLYLYTISRMYGLVVIKCCSDVIYSEVNIFMLDITA